MRPKRLVAGVVLTAVLAVAVLPGVAGSRAPSSDSNPQTAAFQAVQSQARAGQSLQTPGPDDPALHSANALEPGAPLVEPAVQVQHPDARSSVVEPAAAVQSSIKPPRYTLSGIATWYNNGTTAMRLPYGTIVRICGAGGCVVRTVTDWGPQAGFYPVRIADLMPSDFRAVCGCGWWVGTTEVTVGIY